MIRALIPNHHSPRSIISFGNHSLECPVIQRMILDHDGESLVFRVQRWTLGDCPAFQGSIEFKSKIVMQMRSSMQLNDKPQGALVANSTLRLRRLVKLSLLLIFLEGHQTDF